MSAAKAVEVPPFDEAALVADVNAIGQAGAQAFEVGFEDSDPVTWWAQAHYRGARVIVEGHARPDLATDALARKILDRGTCTHCGRTVTLVRRLASRRCWWRRDEATSAWIRGCA